MTDSDSPFSYEQPKLSPGYGLWLVSNRWQRLINQALAPLELTHLQFVLLASLGWLSRSPGTVVTQVQLARHAGSEAMTTSNALKLLERKMWVERRPHPTDTRANVLSLTPSGRALMAEAVRRVEATDREFFGRLGEGGEAAILKAFSQLLDTSD